MSKIIVKLKSMTYPGVKWYHFWDIRSGPLGGAIAAYLTALIAALAYLIKSLIEGS